MSHLTHDDRVKIVLVMF